MRPSCIETRSEKKVGVELVCFNGTALDRNTLTRGAVIGTGIDLRRGRLGCDRDEDIIGSGRRRHERRTAGGNDV